MRASESSLLGKGCVTAASLVLGVLLLLGAEGALRLAGFPQGKDPFRFEAAFENLSSERLIVSHRTRFFTVAANFRFAPTYAGPYANGDWPFRGRPPTADRGMQTVLVLGDSCVFGSGLDPSDTLAQRLQVELARRGHEPDQVEVLNFGVPGYSSVQIRALLEECLEELEADLVILYPAAWNDQAPATGVDDLDLRERGPDPRLAEWLRNSALGQWVSRRGGTSGTDGRAETWEERRARYGERVPEAALADELGAMVDLCAQRAAKLVFIAPAHPAATARAHPRTRRDADQVKEVAAQRGIACLDAQELFASTGLADDALFLDCVHPTHAGIEALSSALAETAVSLLGPARPPLAAALSIASVRPEVVSAMGDEELCITLDRPVAEPVAVTVGGALLLDARRASPCSIVGTLAPNRPGLHGIIVDSAGTGTAWRADAISLQACRLEPSADDPRTLRVVSRPGDQALVFFSSGTTSPRWTRHGFSYLDDATALADPLRCTCAADGVGQVTLRPEVSGRSWAQALVLPRGLLAENLNCALWSNPLEVVAEPLR